MGKGPCSIQSQVNWLRSRLFSVHQSARLLVPSQNGFPSLFITRLMMAVSTTYITIEFSWSPREQSRVCCVYWALTRRRCDCQSELSGVCLWGNPISGCRVLSFPLSFMGEIVVRVRWGYSLVKSCTTQAVDSEWCTPAIYPVVSPLVSLWVLCQW